MKYLPNKSLQTGVTILALLCAPSICFATDKPEALQPITPNSETIKVTLDQFDVKPSTWSLNSDAALSETNTESVRKDGQKFQTVTEIAISPRYVLTEDSVAYIGASRMNNEEFVKYQDSALTPEGRLIEPMESLASVGIRSKF